MSTLLGATLSIPRVHGIGPAAQGHQSNCGRSPTIRSRRWRNWSERHRQREALRELADDKHLLADIGLTREQALGEAAKPFWR
jgi:uncharacterized protein YjiS (DUF1127 family)